MEAIGMLAGGVAHDLNNELSGIVSYPELLLLDLPYDSPLREPITTIQKSGERAATIVQDLLTMARRGVAVTEVVNLNHIINELLKSPEFKKLKTFHPYVDVQTVLANDLMNVKGSATHLSKTIMNLAVNAAEAMPSGGSVTISSENIYIDRPLRGYEHVEEGDYAMIAVADTGIGISAMDRERIFEPFYTKKKMGRSGSGLGMAVVWGTVKDHNGYIDIQSIEGRGTTFTLYFPVTREGTSENVHRSIEQFRGRGESVLVIDDSEVQRKVAKSILESLGYTVVTVSGGEEAVAYLMHRPVDLLLLDMIMDPGMDGLDTYRQIIQRHPGQKAIIVSGFSETTRVKEAQRLGAGPYIKKPYSIIKIAAAAKNILTR
jgi:CheY-like chemotaxis protein